MIKAEKDFEHQMKKVLKGRVMNRFLCVWCKGARQGDASFLLCLFVCVLACFIVV